MNISIKRLLAFLIISLLLTFIIAIVHSLIGPGWAGKDTGFPLTFFGSQGLATIGGESNINNYYNLIIDIIFWFIVIFALNKLLKSKRSNI